MHINPRKQKEREAAARAKVFGLNRECRRLLKKAEKMSRIDDKQKDKQKIKIKMPYRANLDSPHDEVKEDRPVKSTLEKGWDTPAPKMAWKKAPPKA